MMDESRKNLPMSDGDGGGSGSGENECLPLRPQNNNNSESCETSFLLPRKRSQATKSPVPPDALGTTEATMADTGGEEGPSAKEAVSGASSPAPTAPAPAPATAKKSSLEPAAVRRDLRATPHKVKHKPHSNFGLDENDEGESIIEEEDMDNDEIIANSNFTGARASLNASFEAAAAAGNTASTHHPNSQNPPAVAAASSDSILANPKYTSPKRRKPSFDVQEGESLSSASTQQQSSVGNAQTFTPMRPPNTIKQKSNRNLVKDGVLFSPKPVYAEKRGNRMLPPRPRAGNAAAAGAGLGAAHAAAPSSPLTPSPKFASRTLTREGSSSFGSSSNDSPAAPSFKFHAFPASLPRVHPKGEAVLGASTPVRLEESLCRDDDSSKYSATSGVVVASGGRMRLRPKPSASKMPPPSPASRRLFMRQRDNTTTIEGGNVSGMNNPPNNGLSLASSFENTASQDQNDISGDWSEATSVKSFTNERIRMSNVPSQVNMMPQNKLKDLEEEEDDDTMVLDDDDDDVNLDNIEKLDEKISVTDLIIAKAVPSINDSRLSRVRLNFGSPPCVPNVDGEPSSALDKKQQQHVNHTQEASLESAMYPYTPRGQEFHMMDNLEVSPIIRMPEDYDHEMVDQDDGCIVKGPQLDVNDDDEPKVMKKSGSRLFHDDEGDCQTRPTIQPLFRNIASPIDTSANSASGVFSAGASSSVASATATINTTASTAYINNTTMNTINSNTSNVTRPTARKVRPMPDTSAFDFGTPSQHSLGSKDSGFNSHKTGGASMNSGSYASDQRMLCPPTPIRTPAWAHHNQYEVLDHGASSGLRRANSLITTKVLAACPPQILDNLSSLEDSMLENDISMDSAAVEGAVVADRSLVHSVNPLFSPVDEGNDENDSTHHRDGVVAQSSCMFRSLEDIPAAEDSTTGMQPLTDAQHATTKQQPPSSEQKSEVTGNNNEGILTPVSFSDFDNLGILGSGAFADVYKVRSRRGEDHNRLYAIKRTRRQFRGMKDRERAMAEVHTMRRLQNALLSEFQQAGSNQKAVENSTSGESAGSHQHQHHHHHHSKSNYGLYLLFFIRAWQQDGFFYCQTELCSRATCRHLRISLSSEWERDIVRYPSLQMCMHEEEKIDPNLQLSAASSSSSLEEDRRLIPERAIWQICHDISRGLFHIHSYGMVHYDIKPSNIFFVSNLKFGTICKIGDFGLTGDIGTRDDGQEGDTVYMPAELLSSKVTKHPGADVFSLGLTLYELMATPDWSLPREGDRWHEVRGGTHSLELPPSRNQGLVNLVKAMITPDVNNRPSAEDICEMEEVKRANASSDSFLSRYINDVEKFNSRREREMESAEEDARRRSSTPIASSFNHVNSIGRARDRTPSNGDDHSHFFRG